MCIHPSCGCFGTGYFSIHLATSFVSNHRTRNNGVFGLAKYTKFARTAGDTALRNHTDTAVPFAHITAREPNQLFYLFGTLLRAKMLRYPLVIPGCSCEAPCNGRFLHFFHVIFFLNLE